MPGAVASAMPGQLAVLDREGFIIAVSPSWTALALDSEADPVPVSIGVNYLDICRKAAAAGNEYAGSALGAIEAVLEDRVPQASVQYPCPVSSGDRWFEMTVEGFRRPERGVIIAHVDITRRRQAEVETRGTDSRSRSQGPKAGHDTQ
jgi:hypothetical protein